MTTELNLQADRPGTFLGLAAHFSGDGFSDMTFDTRAVSREEFFRWVTDARISGPTLDEAAYRSLLRQTSNLQVITYRSVMPQLFEAIVSRQLPPGEGPRLMLSEGLIAR
jgi:cytochrome o ubiquinol oxidase subunit II